MRKSIGLGDEKISTKQSDGTHMRQKKTLELTNNILCTKRISRIDGLTADTKNWLQKIHNNPK